MFFKILFACRVKFHKYAGIDDLDEWPAVKVSNPLRFKQNMVYAQTVRLGLNA